MKSLLSLQQNPNTGRKSDTEDTDHRVLHIGNFPNRHRQDDAFVNAWARWLEYRKRNGLQTTQKALRGQIKVLANLDPDQAIKAIDRAISKGWDALFEYLDDTTKQVSQLPASDFQKVEETANALKEIIHEVDEGRKIHESKAYQIALTVFAKWQSATKDQYYLDLFPHPAALLQSFWSEYVLQRNRIDYVIQHPAVAMAREDSWQEFSEMMFQKHGKEMTL